MHPFSYIRPSTYDEALDWLARTDQRVMPVAGATDLIPLMRDGVLKPDAVLDIKELPGMRDLGVVTASTAREGTPTTCLYIGAAVRINEISRSAIVGGHWLLLALAAASLGNEQIRNRATIGDNLCTASPAADTAPALYALEAVALIRGPDGERTLPVAEFITGARRNALRSGELLTGLLIPETPAHAQSHREKLSRRKAGDLAVASVAVMAYPKGGATG
jgi:CO/xanthine dehydrogenase FAD-binding subunit